MVVSAELRVEQFVERLVSAWNSHDLARLVPLYDEAFEGEDVGAPFPIRGREGVRAWAGPYWEAFPDMAFEIEETICQGDCIVLVWTARGTHLGPLMGVPPTGHAIFFKGVSVLTVRGDRVARGLYAWNVADLLKQLGLMA